MGFWKGTGRLGHGLLEKIGETSIGLGKASLGAANVIGSPTTHFASKAPGKFAAAIGLGAMAGAIGADAAGEDPGDGAKVLGLGAFAAASLGGAGLVTGLGATALGAAGSVAAAAGGIGRSMINMPIDKITGKAAKVGFSNLNEIKMNKLGMVAMATVGVIGGFLSAEKKFEQSRMGINDGMMRSATPMLPMPEQNTYSNPGSYGVQDSGATGDLVFAMHNNR